MIILVIILIIIIILIFSLFMCIHYSKPIEYNPRFVSDTHIAIENTRYRIPHIFWAYWHDPNNIPPIVNECFISWRRHYPTYSIIIVNNNTISKYINRDELPNKFDQIKAHQMRSDFIRLALLKKYGGVWLDATILMMKPIAHIWLDHKYDLAGFNQPLFETVKDKPIFESWFISAPKNSKIIDLWNDEFTHAVDDFDTIDDYLIEIKKDGVDLQKLWLPGTSYLTIHVCFLVIQTKYPDILSNLYIESANAPHNPFGEDYDEKLFTCLPLFYYHFYFNKYNEKQNMIKLTSLTRMYINKLSAISHNDSAIRLLIRENSDYLKSKYFFK